MYSLHQLLQVKRNNQCLSPRGCWVRQKVSCILHHRDPQLRLAYSWARPIGLAAGKGRGGMFLFLVSSLSFIFLFLPCPSHSSPLLSLFSFQAFKRALLFLLFLLFPTLFLCSYFSLLFSENSLLFLLFSPKMFEVTKNCNFFHAVFARSQFLKIRSTEQPQCRSL